jgi:hypothetical protein
MANPVCAVVLGLLCLGGNAGPTRESPPNGLFSIRSVKTHGYELDLTFSDAISTYKSRELNRTCIDKNCFVSHVWYENCDINFILFRDRGTEEIGPTGVNYTMSGKDWAALQRGLSEVYVGDVEQKRALFPLANIVDRSQAELSCKR